MLLGFDLGNKLAGSLVGQLLKGNLQSVQMELFHGQTWLDGPFRTNVGHSPEWVIAIAIWESRLGYLARDGA